MRAKELERFLRGGITTNWDQVRVSMPGPAEKPKSKRSSVGRRGDNFRRALDWLTDTMPELDYDQRCKRAHEVATLYAKRGLKMPRISKAQREANRWQRSVAIKRAEKC